MKKWSFFQSRCSFESSSLAECVILIVSAGGLTGILSLSSFPVVLYKQDLAVAGNMLSLFAFFSISSDTSLPKKWPFLVCVCVFMLGVGACTWNSRVFAHAKSGPAKAGQLVVSCGKSVLQCLSLLLILWSKCVIVPGKGEFGWFWVVTDTAVSLTVGKLGLGVFYCRLSKSAALMWVQGRMWCSVNELVVGRAVSGGNRQVARLFWVLWLFFKSHRSSSSNRPIWSKK